MKSVTPLLLLLSLLLHDPLSQEGGSPELDALIEQMSSGEERDHEETVQKLKARIPDLLKQLRAARPTDRARAAWALGGIQVKESVPPLVTCLADTDPEVRTAALRALEQLRAAEGGGAAAKLLADPDDGVRRLAIRTVRALRAQEAVPVLTELLRSDQESVRLAATEALAKVGNADLAPHLIRLLQDPSDDVARQAAETLGALGATMAERVLADLASKGMGRRSVEAVDALAALGAKDLSPDLLRLAGHDQAVIRAHAFRALSKLGIRQGLGAIEHGLRDQSAGVRSAGVEAAAGLALRELIPRIGERLQDPDDGVRAAAITALGELGVEEALSDILPLIMDENSEVASAARWTMARLGTRLEEERLVLLAKLPGSSWRREAVRTLGEMEAKQAAGPVIRVLEDPDPDIQLAAIAALGRFRLPDKVRTLVLFGKQHPDVSPIPILSALGVIDGKDSEDALRAALQDPDPEARILAAAFLSRRGVRDEAASLVREARNPRLLNALNALRQPGVWKRLEGHPFPKAILQGRRKELLRELAREGQLTLMIPSAFTKLEDSWLDEPIRKRLDRSASTLEVLEELMGGLDLKSPYGMILEADAVRIVPAVELQGFWSNWLRDTERRSK